MPGKWESHTPYNWFVEAVCKFESQLKPFDFSVISIYLSTKPIELSLNY
jgi:hypothetical protein